MKKKIPFDISYREKIESGEVELTTDDGRRVKVLQWDVNSDKPIVAIIQSDIPDTGRDSVVCYSVEGTRQEGVGPSDLAILIEEDLTEFEKVILESMASFSCMRSTYKEKDLEDYAKEEAPKFLEAAKEALRPEFDEKLEKAHKNQDDIVYQRGYDAGFQAGSEIDEERLTDKIAEKIAEKILKDGNPFAPNPAIPGYPWTTPGRPYEPITVMYGVTPTEFKPMAGNPSVDAFGAATSATTEPHKGSDPL